MLTPAQIRAARGLLDWSARTLAEKAGVHITTVQRMERAQDALRGSVRSVEKIQRTLESAGVEFIAANESGPGVRLNNDRADQ